MSLGFERFWAEGQKREVPSERRVGTFMAFREVSEYDCIVLWAGRVYGKGWGEDKDAFFLWEKKIKTHGHQ